MQEQVPMAIVMTWADIWFQNIDARARVIGYDEALKEHLIDTKDIQAVVQREIVGSVKSELSSNIAEAEKRMLYEFQAYSEDDLKCSKLTKREIEILRLRMIHNRCVDVAEILKIDPQSVSKSYGKAVKKIRRYQKLKNQGKGEVNLLSEQQRQIYELIERGIKNKEISEILNIEATVVKTQKSRIKKMGLITKR